MNNKGFTLVELLAVITILGILALMVTPAVIKVRENVLTNDLKGKVKKIETAALDYGEKYYMDIPSLTLDDVTVEEGKGLYSNQYCEKNRLICEKTSSGQYQFYKKTSSQKCSPSGSEINCYKKCLLVSVRTLIEEGYLASDDSNEVKLTSPLNGENLLNYYVCIRFDDNDINTRQTIAYLENECGLYKNSGDCE